MSSHAPDVWLRAILEVVDEAGEQGLSIEEIEDRVGRAIRSAESAQIESYVKAAEDRGWIEPVNGGQEIRLSKTGDALVSGIRARQSELDVPQESEFAEGSPEVAKTSREKTAG